MSIFQNYKDLVEEEVVGTKRTHVLEILEAGIRSVLPEKAVPEFLEREASALPPKITLFGWGKASSAMYESFKDSYQGDISSGNIIILSEEKTLPVQPRLDISFGAHPLPDSSSIESGERLLSKAEELGEEDTLICLISGGGSSMFEVPREGIDPENLKSIYKLLIESGADIHEVNSVRRALSRSKGGGLARVAYPARIINIVISDVIGNNLEDISSGPTVHDPFTITPQQVIKKYNFEERLDDKILDVVKDYEPVEQKHLQNVKTYIIADNGKAQDAMMEKAKSLGYNPTRYSGFVSGEARYAAHSLMNTEGEMIIGGGETTVTLKGSGQGGRNQEFVLGGLKDLKHGILASVGTDGIDGSSEAAGAIGDIRVKETADSKGYDIDSFLNNNDSYGFFRDCDGLLITGTTGTNVADVCVYVK
jgi:glycerate-2-kinase